MTDHLAEGIEKPIALSATNSHQSGVECHMPRKQSPPKVHIIRQGDVVLRKVADRQPTGPTRDITLAVGEESGHSHVVRGVEELVDGRRYVTVAQGDQMVVAGIPWRHEPIAFDADDTVPAGTWGVVIEREYTPEAIRQVAD